MIPIKDKTAQIGLIRFSKSHNYLDCSPMLVI